MIIVNDSLKKYNYYMLVVHVPFFNPSFGQSRFQFYCYLAVIKCNWYVHKMYCYGTEQCCGVSGGGGGGGGGILPVT